MKTFGKLQADGTITDIYQAEISAGASDVQVFGTLPDLGPYIYDAGTGTVSNPPPRRPKLLPSLAQDISAWIGTDPALLKKAVVAALAIAAARQPGIMQTLGIPVSEDQPATR